MLHVFFYYTVASKGRNGFFYKQLAALNALEEAIDYHFNWLPETWEGIWATTWTSFRQANIRQPTLTKNLQLLVATNKTKGVPVSPIKPVGRKALEPDYLAQGSQPGRWQPSRQGGLTYVEEPNHLRHHCVDHKLKHHVRFLRYICHPAIVDLCEQIPRSCHHLISSQKKDQEDLPECGSKNRKPPNKPEQYQRIHQKTDLKYHFPRIVY